MEQEDIRKLFEPLPTAGISDEALTVLLRAEAHFYNRRQQLETILKHKDARVTVGDITLEPGTAEMKGFRAGIRTALSLIGGWPLKLAKESEPSGSSKSGVNDA